MHETYGLVAFRSRQQVLRMETQLKRKGITCSIISTPREIAVGCGLSIRFKPEDLSRVIAEYRDMDTSALIGFYMVDNNGQRQSLRPVSVGSGFSGPNPAGFGGVRSGMPDLGPAPERTTRGRP